MSMTAEVTKNCIICGAAFGPRRRWDDRFPSRRTCNRQCQGKWNALKAEAKTTRVCRLCRRELSRDRFDKARRGSNKVKSYCRDCLVVQHRLLYNHRQRNSGGSTKRDPMKSRAKNLFQSAMRRGKIQRQPCEICGEHAEGHHPDYSKPYEVRWLCSRHHKRIHWKPVDTPLIRALREEE